MNPLVLGVDDEPDVEVLFRHSAPTASQWSLRNLPPWHFSASPMQATAPSF